MLTEKFLSHLLLSTLPRDSMPAPPCELQMDLTLGGRTLLTVLFYLF